MDETIMQLYGQSAQQSAAGAFAQAMGGMINYESLRVDAYSAKVQANNIELQAKERANMLRERYNNAVGNTMFGATMRGGRVTSGSVRGNIESSAKNLGEDIRKTDLNASMAASSMRTKAKMLKHQANASLAMGITNAALTLGGK